jgi:hypothetical protein
VYLVRVSTLSGGEAAGFVRPAAEVK